MSSHTTKLVVLAAVLVLAPAVATGCLAVAVGGAAVGTVAWVEGALVESVPAAPDKVVAATEKAFASLKLTLISKTASGLEGKVIGRTSDDKSVTVTVKSKGEKVSEVNIRFGTFGDEAKSRILMDAIHKNL